LLLVPILAKWRITCYTFIQENYYANVRQAELWRIDNMERALLSGARYDKEWSIEHAAELVGVDPTTYWRWEKGSCTPHPAHLRRLCKVFGKTEQELGFEEGVTVVAQNTTAGEEVEDALTSFRQHDLTLRLLRVVWHWPTQDARYHKLQALLMLELEDNSRMTPDHINRRNALRRLALLPIEMYGLSALTAVLKPHADEVLAHCSAGITACWYLRKGKDLAFASDAVSKYIPTLQVIVKSAPAAQRKAAADLLAQCFLLKSTLTRHTEGNNEAIIYAQHAESYGEMADNSILLVLALRTQAAAYYYANYCEQALQVAEKAKYLLETANIPIPLLVHSYVYAGLATYQAHNGHEEDALAALENAHATFFAQLAHEPSPIWIDHSQANLLLNDGMTHFYLGLQKAALDSLAQVEGIRARSELIHVEALIDQVMAEVSRDDQPRNMEWCIDLWIRGVEGAKALQSNQRFNEAIQVYTAMRAAWPGEKRVKELREQIVHW
jgi:transcriptional regulator with XRE-family HTH domain